MSGELYPELHASEQDSPEARNQYLETGILRLPNADFSYGAMYPAALRTQAVPVVDFLAQIEEEGVKRQIPVIAEYGSARGGDDLLYASSWDRDLAHAINDLGHAAGLRIASANRGLDGTRFELPKHFKRSLKNMQLPPTLRRRVNDREGENTRELDELIRKRAEWLKEMQEARNPSFKRRLFQILNLRQRTDGATTPLLDTPPDFTLAINMDFDMRSYASDYKRDTWSYQRLIHKITLVSETPS